MAEREGFEPPCRLPDKTLSRRPRYDHFGTSPLFPVDAGLRRPASGSFVPLALRRSLRSVARLTPKTQTTILPRPAG